MIIYTIDLLNTIILIYANNVGGLLMSYYIPSFPSGEPVSDLFEVFVEGQSMSCYTARVSAMPFNRPWTNKQRPLDQSELSSFVVITAESEVELTIMPKRNFQNAIVRPVNSGITPIVKNGIIRFCAKVGQYSLEIDGTHFVLTYHTTT